jgi:hypothetical protein
MGNKINYFQVFGVGGRLMKCVAKEKGETPTMGKREGRRREKEREIEKERERNKETHHPNARRSTKRQRTVCTTHYIQPR